MVLFDVDGVVIASTVVGVVVDDGNDGVVYV